jgi:N-acetyl-alpha-D-muramate 1-phosphate uridylyltransferase
MIDTAMVMAAGLGKRMRPLTASRPKPLVKVAGQTLLDHSLDHLRSAGVRRAVVNVHYLAGSIEAHLKHRGKGLDIAISDERDLLLETGGGVVRAMPLINRDSFFVVNSDNLWVDGPTDSLRLLADRWDDELMDGLLLVVPLARANCHRGQGDFHMDPEGLLSRRRATRVAPFVYTGIQLVSRRLFADAPAGAFSTNILWDRAIATGRLYGLSHPGLWFDVGTPEAVTQTEALLGRE